MVVWLFDCNWDGDTLVVETTGFREDVWLDVEGSPLTSTGRRTERFRRVDYGHLKIEITAEDPKAYTKPWTVTVKQRATCHFLEADSWPGTAAPNKIP
jgi:hypothetical protein